jgi:hypothetical protein
MLRRFAQVCVLVLPLHRHERADVPLAGLGVA